MGEYLQMGIVYQMQVFKNDRWSAEVIREKLGSLLDLSLFTMREETEEIQFTIQEDVLTQLRDFLSRQFALYAQADPYAQIGVDQCFQALPQGKVPLQSLVDLAEERSLEYFQASDIYSQLEVAPFHYLRYETHMFAFFLEGKILMEEYNTFLKYIESLIRQTSGSLSIAGAVRAFIQ